MYAVDGQRLGDVVRLPVAQDLHVKFHVLQVAHVGPERARLFKHFLLKGHVGGDIGQPLVGDGHIGRKLAARHRPLLVEEFAGQAAVAQDVAVGEEEARARVIFYQPGEFSQPARQPEVVGVEEGDIVAGGALHGVVAAAALAAVGVEADKMPAAPAGEFPENFRGGVGGAVVDYEGLVVRERLGGQAFKRPAQQAGAVI